jgi:hypothetical protein
MVDALGFIAEMPLTTTGKAHKALRKRFENHTRRAGPDPIGLQPLLNHSANFAAALADPR